MTPDLIRRLRAARAVATPLIGVETSEPAGATRAISEAVNGSAPCKLTWDCIRGLAPLTPGSGGVLTEAAALMDITGETLKQVSEAFCDPIAAFELVGRLPGESLAIFHNAHRLFDGTPSQTFGTMQAVWNLRDVLKSNGTTLVMLAPAHSLPVELTQDVTILREPLPSSEDIAQTLADVYASCELDAPTDETMQRATVALRGLNRFAVEQAAAESMGRKGIDIKALWNRKRAIIEQTKGATFQTNGLLYSNIGGSHAVKDYFTALFSGPCAPEVVVMIDEFDKQMAGSDAAGDNGVGRDILQVILREMVEHDYPGAIFAGHPGTGKTALTEAIAMQHNVPLLKADLNAVKGSLMGESEAGIRDFFKMVAGLTGEGGRALFVGCVNKMHDSIPPELRRRFTRRGVWFFDLPTRAEKDSIWTVTLDRFDRVAAQSELPNDANWTGADIYNCCEIAHALSIPLIAAAAYLVPVAVSDPESIVTLRKSADNRWLSASTPGPYQMAQPAAVATTAPAANGRKIKITEEA